MPDTCPICHAPEVVTVYPHIGVSISECENTDCPMCSKGWLDWREMFRLSCQVSYTPLYGGKVEFYAHSPYAKS